MMKKVFLVVAVLSINVMSQAMEEAKAQLPSAQMLRIYLADKKCVGTLEMFGIKVLDALCEQFGGQETSPKNVQDFIWQKVKEGESGYLPMSISCIVDTVVELTFQDSPQVYKAFVEREKQQQKMARKSCDFGLEDSGLK